MKRSRVVAMVLALVMVVSLTPVYAAEVMPLTDDEYYSMTYYPDCGGEVTINYKISVTSSGVYYPSVVSTSTSWVKMNDVMSCRFVPEYCTVSSKDTSGFTMKLYGYLQLRAIDGSSGTDGYYTYYIRRNY